VYLFPFAFRQLSVITVFTVLRSFVAKVGRKNKHYLRWLACAGCVPALAAGRANGWI
jgi:hypothetical protein